VLLVSPNRAIVTRPLIRKTLDTIRGNYLTHSQPAAAGEIVTKYSVSRSDSLQTIWPVKTKKSQSSPSEWH